MRIEEVKSWLSEPRELRRPNAATSRALRRSCTRRYSLPYLCIFNSIFRTVRDNLHLESESSESDLQRSDFKSTATSTLTSFSDISLSQNYESSISHVQSVTDSSDVYNADASDSPSSGPLYNTSSHFEKPFDWRSTSLLNMGGIEFSSMFRVPKNSDIELRSNSEVSCYSSLPSTLQSISSLVIDSHNDNLIVCNLKQPQVRKATPITKNISTKILTCCGNSTMKVNKNNVKQTSKRPSARSSSSFCRTPRPQLQQRSAPLPKRPIHRTQRLVSSCKLPRQKTNAKKQNVSSLVDPDATFNVQVPSQPLRYALLEGRKVGPDRPHFRTKRLHVPGCGGACGGTQLFGGCVMKMRGKWHVPPFS